MKAQTNTLDIYHHHPDKMIFGYHPISVFEVLLTGLNFYLLVLQYDKSIWKYQGIKLTLQAASIVLHSGPADGSQWNTWATNFSSALWTMNAHNLLKKKILWFLNSLLSSGDFCCWFIASENSLNPEQARQKVWPVLDSNCLTLMVFLKVVFKNWFILFVFILIPMK